MRLSEEWETGLCSCLMLPGRTPPLETEALLLDLSPLQQAAQFPVQGAMQPSAPSTTGAAADGQAGTRPAHRSYKGSNTPEAQRIEALKDKVSWWKRACRCRRLHWGTDTHRPNKQRSGTPGYRHLGQDPHRGPRCRPRHNWAFQVPYCSLLHVSRIRLGQHA